MKNEISSILVSEQEIQQKVKELAAKISKDYEGKNPIVICILKGAAMFMSDLIKHVTIPLEIDFMSLSSYGDSTKSSGVVRIKKDIDSDISGRHVIIVEDIVDSGLTLKYIDEYFLKHNCKSVKICTLLDKPEAHKTDLEIDYVGFEVGNEFVVGFGLDYAQKYRNLPFIGILKKEVYN
ncbi:MAG: hypoxanthine phosphoribosyltransferase [Candidatus Cloacimonetes bacterium]|nr:hypoxanthine phosphoribosyltransferase [Candidatus Cloacimonadota bacterium]MCF7814450.1 hypoxanthine phosphoribosyltransferase [Candidatus Cloacimonadota bacterium]MCF7869025.1 hypoxanthine phosphoribosyltransferase [Candidatus Cloacimonadota bacterium]MCF7884420.1 hypoxanthine phosphoribosyltransferase [Candidatus Cloacimonadota bacterium]